MEFQSMFHRYWQHLQDPHVRALAWMLTSPDMLSQRAPVWGGQIGTVPLGEPQALIDWLTALDRHPTPLYQALELQKHRRLGHYAERLLSFYLQHQGLLFAHGLQVRQHGVNTVGEFDFLVRQPRGLVHWELATKFYLYAGYPAPRVAQDGVAQGAGSADLYNFVGPNLADTLGGKMKKVIGQQLALSRHPAALHITPELIIKAQAVIKGWLFYRNIAEADKVGGALSGNHCRGFWWLRSDIDKVAISHAMILPRLQWLAPAQAREDETINKATLQDTLDRHFLGDNDPVMVAIMRGNGNVLQEMCRGFVVPENWIDRLNERREMLRSPLL